MIFVTVGTHYIGFDRLVKKMDEITPNLGDEVMMQIGHTDYEPKHAKWFKFSDYDEILNIIKKSDIIICHGGAGTLLDILKLNKPVVIVPRLKKYKEVYDDHELELAESLTKKVITVFNIENLEETINKWNSKKIKDLKTDNRLSNFLKEYLRGLT